MVTFDPAKSGEQAGLVVFQNSRHNYTFVKTIADGEAVVKLFKATEDGNEELASAKAPAGALRLQVSFVNDAYNFSYAGEEGDFTALAEGVPGKYLSTQEAGGFVGVTIGMYATSSGATSDNTASFDWFRYAGDDAVLRK